MNKKGMPISDGIGIGEFLFIENEKLEVPKHKITDVSNEIKVFEDAVSLTIKQIKLIKEKTIVNVDLETAKIFDAHLLIANDEEIKASVYNLIKSSNLNSAHALLNVADNFISIFKNMDNEYFRERALDIEDVTTRIIKNILNIPIVNLSEINSEVILGAYDLTPSQVSQIDKKFIKGIITSIGGKTSHTAIIARLMSIPVVSNIKTEALRNVKNGTKLIINGSTGEVVLNPSKEVLENYKKEFQKNLLELEKDKEYINKKSTTKDNVTYELVANIGSTNDLPFLEQYGAEGVGLFRTEFLYLEQKNFPTEDFQYEVYKEVLEKNANKPVVIRTMDIGGDKVLPYLKLEHEDNPFLGVRAIRLSFKHIELFKTQIRALLRASVHGNLKIMFPMIATKGEFLKAKDIVLEMKQELDKENIKYSNNIEIGIMIEIPASAIMADDLAKVVDFFSIGTNDLIQYTMAADRLNNNLSYLYQPLNPAILKLIKMVGKASKDNGIWAGVCGEMGGNLKSIPLLLGFGITELSMAPPKLLKARRLINNSTHEDFVKLADKALTLSTEEEVLDLVDAFLEKNYK